MPARKTESRFPLSLQGADLGQAVAAADGKCTLVSFVTAPLIVKRENRFVLFTTDASLASQAASFEWTVTEGAAAPSISTSGFGELAYTPQAVGDLTVTVRILDSGGTEQASLTLTSQVTSPSAELETLIQNAVNETGPSIGSADVLRELINEHNLYYQNVTLPTPEAGDAFQRLVFSLVYDGAARRKPEQRQQHMDELALALNEGTADFATLCSQGAGVCGLRPVLLAMVAPGMLPWTFLPQDDNQRALALEQLLQAGAALSEDKRIDLFNLVRFPKANITFCGNAVDTLRTQYFSGTTFDTVLTGTSGVRAQWLIDQFQRGPITRT